MFNLNFLSLKVYDDPNRQPMNAPFGTYMILVPTAFFLGILFAGFPYDFPLLWSADEPTAQFMAMLESHLTFMYNAPPVIPRILHIAIFIGFAGHLMKMFKPSESNLLFDGSSLVLYFIGVIIYLTNIAQGLKMVAEGKWEDLSKEVEARLDGDVKIGKEDSMRVLAASNTILALVLVGVLVLQAGQWYAEKRDGEERKAWQEKQKAQQVVPEGEKKVTRSASSKKKQ